MVGASRSQRHGGSRPPASQPRRVQRRSGDGPDGLLLGLSVRLYRSTAEDLRSLLGSYVVAANL